MAGRRRTTSFSGVLVAALLAVILLPAFLSAGPIGRKPKGDEGDSVPDNAAANRKLVRNRRNISWYKQNSDFWGWYKYFTENGNQEAIQEMDRIYLAYLQNKNRAEGRRSYKAYLRHLGDIYKSCSDSDDPDCVSSYTSRPKPEAPKPAPVKTCDPTKDAYCLYAALVQGKSPYLPLALPAAAPAPVKAPAPMYARSAAPAKDTQSGYYYYSPSASSFLSKEQKTELLRICAAEDVECMQYHLRAAHGHAPSAGPQPSYAHLGCDPSRDPNCNPKLVQKASSGLYLQYPNCDPLRDPLCAHSAALAAPRAPNPPAAAGPGSCNPLYEDGCNPLTATRFANPPKAYRNEDDEEAAAIRAAPSAGQSDPYAMFRDAYANANRVNDPYAMQRQANDPYAMQHQANDPYAMQRQAAANDPYAMQHQAAANDPYAMQRQAAANDPYAMQRQANDPYAMQHQAAANDPYAMQHQAAANDPYAMQRQAPASPAANDPYAMLRRFMAQAQGNNPHAEHMEAAPETNPNDPFGAIREAAAAMHRRGGAAGARQQFPFASPSYEEPAPEERHPLGPPGKTKEGYECFVGYDRECTPVAKPAEPRAHRPVPHPAEAHEPHLNADGTRSGVLEPSDPHCDPEYDRDCRLRRYEPEPEAERRAEEDRSQGAAESEQPEQPEPYEGEPNQSGQEEPHMAYQPLSQGMPSLQDILRRYGDQHPEQVDHRAYGDDYRKK
ncbi:actinodin1 [Pseudoliparis swirei]|uniref:actinodin1 n=1 Tax=Pseudoliparis swirei TaxID=2059687 RepID=UPI0024BDF1F4|nr:actinodin1 [Pseudoliparis swirei]